MVGPGDPADCRVFEQYVELGDGGFDEPGHRRPTGRGAIPVALRGGLEQPREEVHPGHVALAPFLGVELQFGQCGEDRAHRCGERVTDRELDEGHGCGIGHPPCHTTDEVEGLELRLLESIGRGLRRAPSDRFEGARLFGRCLRPEVGEQVVVAGKPVQRSGQRVGVERRSQELGGKVVR